MYTQHVIESLWQDLIWPACQQAKHIADAELQFFEALPLACELYLYWQKAAESSPEFNWLLAQAESSDLALWQHLLGLCVWHSAGQVPFELEAMTKRKHFRIPYVFATPMRILIQQSADYQALSNADNTQWQAILNQSYLRWDRLIKRRSMSPADRAFLFHWLAHTYDTWQSEDPCVRELAECLWVVLIRRLSDEPEAFVDFWRTAQQIKWQNLPGTEAYAAILNLMQPFDSFLQDRWRGEQFRHDYFRQLNAESEASEILEKKLSTFLKNNDLKLAALQGWVRQLNSVGNQLHYQLIETDSQEALPIYGWHGTQWKAYHHLNSDYLQKQNDYLTASSAFWAKLPPELFQNLNPISHFETSWLPIGDILLFALIAAVFETQDDLQTIVHRLQLTEPSRLASLWDSIKRKLLPARSYGSVTDWPESARLLALISWVLGHSLWHAEDRLETLLDNCQLLRSQALPEQIPTGLHPAIPAYSGLCSDDLHALIPVKWAQAELALNADTQPSYVCFIHPLSYDKAHADAPRLTAALMTGRFYLPPLAPGSQTPFVAAYYRHYLQAFTELARHWVDTAIYQERKHFAYQQAQAAHLNERHREFKQVQAQMVAYDRARSELDSLWHGIQQSLRPPAYAAYGIADWRRLQAVFDDTQSFRGITGSHNLSTVTAHKLSIYLDYLSEGNLDQEHFVGKLQIAWKKLTQPTDRQARQYFALLKLIVHDGLDAKKPLSLIQLLWTLRWVQETNSCPMHFVRVSDAQSAPTRAVDLSDLISLDSCSWSQFYLQLAETSGFDFDRLDYSMATPPVGTLNLPHESASGLWALRLSLFLTHELQHPEHPDYLRLQQVWGIWQDKQGLLLQILCQNTPSAKLKQTLQGALSDPSNQVHSLRDCIHALLEASSGSLVFADVSDKESIPAHSGIGFWSLKAQNQTLISIQLGSTDLNSTLYEWRQHWQMARQRPAGI